jgi:hypothetical protein
LELVRCILKILNGNYPQNDKNLISFETTAVKINLIDDGKISFFGDGEILNQSTSWDIKCHHHYLSVFSPKDQKDTINLCTQGSLI